MGWFPWTTPKKEEAPPQPKKKICCACPETKVSFFFCHLLY